jgi:hypothetical protein
MAPAGDDTYVSCTPYTLTLKNSTSNSVSFAVSTKSVAATCTCRAMNLADVKFVIEDDCRGAVSGIKIRDSRSLYSRSPVYSTDEEYPISGGDATTFRVVFPNVSDAWHALG